MRAAAIILQLCEGDWTSKLGRHCILKATGEHGIVSGYYGGPPELLGVKVSTDQRSRPRLVKVPPDQLTFEPTLPDDLPTPTHIYLGGITAAGAVHVTKCLTSACKSHGELRLPSQDRFRYTPDLGLVGWWEPPSPEATAAVEEYFVKRGLEVTQHRLIQHSYDHFHGMNVDDFEQSAK